MTIIAQRRAAERAEPENAARARASFAVVDRIKAGDREAFGELYQQYYRSILLFVQRRVGSREIAEDLTQDVFLRAFRRVDQLQWDGKPVLAWLLTIARNATVDHYKSARHRLEFLDGFGSPRPADEEISREPEPEDAVLAYLAGRDLLTSVLELNADQQDVLILRFWRGLNVAETAAAMGRQEGAVKALQYRATRALGRVLGLASGQVPEPTP